MKHYETHLYTYATALTVPLCDTALAALKYKAIKYGHTEGECQLVEDNPRDYIKHGIISKT